MNIKMVSWGGWVELRLTLMCVISEYTETLFKISSWFFVAFSYYADITCVNIQITSPTKHLITFECQVVYRFTVDNSGIVLPCSQSLNVRATLWPVEGSLVLCQL